MTINVPPRVFDLTPIPAIAGVGLKSQHFNEILETLPSPMWFEVHTENYMSDGGPHHKYLDKIREDYAVSFHGVSLSIGSQETLNLDILERTRQLIKQYQPALVSEHLSWSVFEEVYFNDLLPLPYTDETLTRVIDHVNQSQDILNQQILIENPSTYLQFVESEIPEHEFLVEVSNRTGCGLLIDVNNLYVNGQNHKIDIKEWLDHIPPTHVHEIHLAGHHVNDVNGQKILIDDHGSKVSNDVWDIYEYALSNFGPTPSLIEWDTRIPAFNTLKDEADRANLYLKHACTQTNVIQQELQYV